MPQNLVIMKLFDNYAIAANSSAEPGVIDMREFIKIESLWVRGVSSAGSPRYSVLWKGGIQADQFQPYTDNADLITDETDEDWHIIYPPDFKSPYVQFKITTHSASNADSRFYLYAYVREDYA